jgi:hypothetical protein
LDDQIHRALDRVWALLRMPELSSALAGRLRQVVQRFDAARLALEHAEGRRQLTEGVRELEQALAFIADSPRASDRAQRAILDEARELLVRYVDEGADDGGDKCAGNRNGGERGARERNETAASIDEQSLAAQIEALGDLDRRRAHLLREPLVRWDTLAQAEARIERATLALKWIGGRVMPYLDQRRMESDELAWDFDLIAASLQIGDGARIEESITCAEAGEVADPDAFALLVSTLSVPDRPESHAAVKTCFARTSHGALRALLLPWLFERQLLPPAEIVPLLSGQDDLVAAAAADVLMWVAGRDYGPLFLQRAASAPVGPRSRAFLRAASVLGSVPALEQVRRAVDAGETNRHFIAALASVGDARDVPRLQTAASQSGPLSALAGLAAAELARPRTLEAAVATLSSPVACVEARTWAASHLAAQTAHRLGTIYRPDASARRQHAAAQAWEAYVRSIRPNQPAQASR